MDMTLLLPEIVVFTGALLVMLIDLYTAPERKDRLAWLAIAVAVLGFAATFIPAVSAGSTTPAFTFPLQSFVVDGLGLYMKRAFLVTAVLVFLISRDYVSSLARARGEFWTLSLFALTGMMLCAGVQDFMSLFVSLETVTLSFFVLCAFRRDRATSVEAGLKLLVIGSLSAGFLLYGIAFVYGATGSIFFVDIARHVTALGHDGTVPTELLFGVVLIFIGLGFKTSAVPLHVWVPDVYQGAPTPVTAYLSVGSKLAGFVLMLRVLVLLTPAGGPTSLAHAVAGLLGVMAALTLLFGNLGALPQTNIKRLMGYSSIAQCGYILVGLAAGWTQGIDGALFYMGSYVVMNLAAFAVIIAVSRATGSHEIDDYAGLSRRSPLLSMALTMALLSLAGVPPLWGFVGKFMLIGSTFARPESFSFWLGVIALICVVIALFYYLRIVKRIWVWEERVKTPITTTATMRAFCVLATVVMLALAIYPVALERTTGEVVAQMGVPGLPGFKAAK